MFKRPTTWRWSGSSMGYSSQRSSRYDLANWWLLLAVCCLISCFSHMPTRMLIPQGVTCFNLGSVFLAACFKWCWRMPIQLGTHVVIQFKPNSSSVPCQLTQMERRWSITKISILKEKKQKNLYTGEILQERYMKGPFDIRKLTPGKEPYSMMAQRAMGQLCGILEKRIWPSNSWILV